MEITEVLVNDFLSIATGPLIWSCPNPEGIDFIQIEGYDKEKDLFICARLNKSDEAITIHIKDPLFRWNKKSIILGKCRITKQHPAYPKFKRFFDEVFRESNKPTEQENNMFFPKRAMEDLLKNTQQRLI